MGTCHFAGGTGIKSPVGILRLDDVAQNSRQSVPRFAGQLAERDSPAIRPCRPAAGLTSQGTRFPAQFRAIYHVMNRGDRREALVGDTGFQKASRPSYARRTLMPSR